MKNRLSLLVIVSLLAAFALTACGGDLKTVNQVGNAFMAALRDGDHETSWSLLAPNIHDEVGAYGNWVDWATPRNFPTYKFTSTVVEGDEAQMEGEAEIDGDTYSVLLVFGRFGEDWLITGVNLQLAP